MRTPSPSRAMTSQPFERRRLIFNLTGNITVPGGPDVTVHNTAAANITTTATLPAAPRLGQRVTAYANNGGASAILRMQCPAGHVIQQGGAASSAGGAAAFPAGTIGGTVTYEYIAANKWGYVAGGGTAPTLS